MVDTGNERQMTAPTGEGMIFLTRDCIFKSIVPSPVGQYEEMYLQFKSSASLAGKVGQSSWSGFSASSPGSYWIFPYFRSVVSNRFVKSVVINAAKSAGEVSFHSVSEN